MPFLQVMSNRANEVFSFDRIQNLKIKVTPETNLTNLMKRLDIARTPAERAALNAFPESIRSALLSVIVRAISPKRGERLQITVSWAPAYDYGVHIWEARSAGGSPPAITIHLEGPYPDFEKAR